MSHNTDPAVPAEDLAIVIPVWNLPEDLAFLLGQISRMGIFSEVIVSDDASDLDCHPERLGFSAERLNARLVCLRSETQRGAGHARNMGLRAVTARNVLFFDADDHLAEGMPQIWARHIRDDIPDFTIFRHTDTRVRDAEGREGSFKADEQQWDAALGTHDEGLLSRQSSAHLCTVSAYPWNKIYRTEFLRAEGIACSETPVHNDIRLHWMSFVRARKILALRNIGAVHIVSDRDHHLTKKRGAERLCLGDILADLMPVIRRSPGSTIFLRHYLHFVDMICRWNLDQIDEALRVRFTELAVQSYLGFTPDEFRIYALWKPDHAEAIVNFLLKEGP